MAIKLEDFWVKEPLNKKVVNFDHEKALKLSDGDFLEHYNQLMNTYQSFFEKNEKVNCNNCHEEIFGPEDLARYMGANVHRGVCIKQVVESEEYWSCYSRRKYFERVVDVTSSDF